MLQNVSDGVYKLYHFDKAVWMIGSPDLMDGFYSVWATNKENLDGNDFDVCTIFLIKFPKLVKQKESAKISPVKQEEVEEEETNVDVLRAKRPPNPRIAKKHFEAMKVRKTRAVNDQDPFDANGCKQD